MLIIFKEVIKLVPFNFSILGFDFCVFVCFFGLKLDGFSLFVDFLSLGLRVFG